MSTLKIVADENIPLIHEFFSELSASLVSKPGRELTAEDVKQADILLVRSITKVNKALLHGSAVKFVGTCTIGTDHLDIAYLDAQGIEYSNAPGCNAQAVVDYVMSALITLEERWQKPWQGLSIGIVGAGNVGSRLYNVLSDLGMNVIAYDPNVPEFSSKSLAESVWQQDVVSVHTPILTEGPNKTLHLVNAQRLNAMKPDAALINSCRGAVVHNADLLKHLNTHPNFQAILDVYEDEPSPSDELIQACLLATPHIAGYSLDGKYRGTSMIYDALCEFLGELPKLTLQQVASEPALQEIRVSVSAPQAFALKTCIRSAYDIRDDHFRMLSLLGLSDLDKAKSFDRLRKEYPIRRDLTQLTFSCGSGVHRMEISEHADWVRALGLTLA